MGTAEQAIAKLEYAIRVLGRLAVLPRELAAAAAPEITRLQRAQYAAGTDPYGTAWQKLAKSTLAKGRRPPPLTDTARMKNRTNTIPLLGARVGLRHFVRTSYAIRHQLGGKNLPKREILPSRGLPPGWRIVLDTEAKRLADRAVA
jgi:hypothetical protein